MIKQAGAQGLRYGRSSSVQVQAAASDHEPSNRSSLHAGISCVTRTRADNPGSTICISAAADYNDICELPSTPMCFPWLSHLIYIPVHDESFRQCSLHKLTLHSIGRWSTSAKLGRVESLHMQTPHFTPNACCCFQTKTQKVVRSCSGQTGSSRLTMTRTRRSL
jgi:hypothetical protein